VVHTQSLLPTAGIVLCSLALFVPNAAATEATADAGESLTTPGTLRAVPLVEGEKLVVDGRLDEAAWQRAEVISDFSGMYPTEGFEPAGSTRVRILTDSKHLYFAWECRFDEPTRVRAYLAQREDINRDDQVGVYLDPFGDGRRAYVFYINALGIQQDILLTVKHMGWNPAWDAVYSSAGRIVDDGFDVEIAIPFRSIRFPADTDSPWKILLTRKFAKRDEKGSHPDIRRERGHLIQQLAPLIGVQPGRSGIGLEFLPTVVGRTGQSREEPDDPLAWTKPTFPGTVDPSVGIKWQVTPSLTFDATVNPDFSQIEADPDQIDHNLRFALFLPERRPFFLEGRELYDRGQLYTRSVVDPIYGVKLSGKRQKLSVAILQALDEAPAPSFVSERETPGFGEEDVEDALAFVTYAGMKYDIGERGELGLLWSDKELIKDGQHHSDHHVVKGSIHLTPNRFSDFHAGVAWSETGRVGGDRLRGPAVSMGAHRNSGVFGIGGGLDVVDPQFRKENAFLGRTDTASLWAYTWRLFEPSRGPVKWLKISAFLSHLADGLRTQLRPAGSGHEAKLELRLPANTQLHVRAELWDELYEGQDFAGGRLGFHLTNHALEILQGTIGGRIGDAINYETAEATLEKTIRANLRLRVFRRLSLDVGTDLSELGRDGELRQRLWVYNAKARLGITRIFSLRLIGQGRQAATLLEAGGIQEHDSRLDLSVLLSLVPKPGTAIYLGYGERLVWDKESKLRTESRDIFLKASLLIRL